MHQFSPATFQWFRLRDAIREAVERYVHVTDRERIRSEAMAARLVLRQAGGVRGSVQHGELVCPSLTELSQTIILEWEDFRIELVHAPGASDLNADRVVFEDDRSVADRCLSLGPAERA